MPQTPIQIIIFGASGDLTARKLIPALVGNSGVMVGGDTRPRSTNSSSARTLLALLLAV